MDRAHAQSRRSIAVLSPDYLASRFTAPEWAARFAQDATSEHDLLLPVRVRSCNVEGLLAQIVYVDLIGCSEETARRKLLQRVEGIRLKPNEASMFPGQASHDAIPERPAFPAVAPTAGRAAALGFPMPPTNGRSVPTIWLVTALGLAALVVMVIGLVVFGGPSVTATGGGVAGGRDVSGITINNSDVKR